MWSGRLNLQVRLPGHILASSVIEGAAQMEKSGDDQAILTAPSALLG
jgi:hypothetical protein